MPRKEDYKSGHWFQTPQPSCPPGYTGYLPQQPFQFGKSYGQTTHSLMTKHPVAGLRLSRIVEFSSTPQQQLDVDAMVWRHEVTTENPKFRSSNAAGYAGYIPRRKFIVGKNVYDECKEAVAMMEKLKRL